MSPVGQSNWLIFSSTTHCEPQSGCFIIQLPRRVLRVYWLGYSPGSVFRERVSGTSSLVCTGLKSKPQGCLIDDGKIVMRAIAERYADELSRCLKMCEALFSVLGVYQSRCMHHVQIIYWKLIRGMTLGDFINELTRPRALMMKWMYANTYIIMSP